MIRTQTNAQAATPKILLVLDDLDLTELLDHVLEGRGYTVCIARSGPSAVAFLRSGYRFDAILADWNPARGVGESLFHWIGEKRPELSSRFIALVSIKPENFDEVTGGRCQLVHSFDLAEVLQVTSEMIEGPRRRKRALARQPKPVATHASEPVAVSPRHIAPKARPSLLLVDDEPLQRDIMTAALGKLGFSVTTSPSGHQAMNSLASTEYDVILSDWYMRDGSGDELYAWLVDNRPELANRCVFMSASASPEELAVKAPKRPFVEKSAGTNALLGYLTGIAARSRSRAIGFMSVPGF